MKLHSIFGLSLLASTSLLADFHEPVVNFSYIPNSDSKFLVSLNHQSTINVTDSTNLMLYAYSNVDKSSKFHHELGIGFRKHFENFGIGLNVVSNHFNKLNAFNHQFVPGVELLFGGFQICFNRYLPLNSAVSKKSNPTLKMYDVSEISATYRFLSNYEVGVAPYFVHQTSEKGVVGHIGAYFFKNWKVTVNPYYRSDEKGASISLGFDFGGPKSVVNAPIQKSHRFFYSAPALPPSKTEASSNNSSSVEESVVSTPAKPITEKVSEQIFLDGIQKKPGGDLVIRLSR